MLIFILTALAAETPVMRVEPIFPSDIGGLPGGRYMCATELRIALDGTVASAAVLPSECPAPFSAAARAAAEQWRFEPSPAAGRAETARFHTVRFVFDTTKPVAESPPLGPLVPADPGDGRTRVGRKDVEPVGGRLQWHMPSSMMNARGRSNGPLELVCVVGVDLDAELHVEAVRPVDCVSDLFDAASAPFKGKRFRWVGEGAVQGPVTYDQKVTFRVR